MSPICPPICQEYLPAFPPRKDAATFPRTCAPIPPAPQPPTHPSPTGQPDQRTQQKVFQNPNQKSFHSSSDIDAQVFWFRSFERFSQPSPADQHAHRSSALNQTQQKVLMVKPGNNLNGFQKIKKEQIKNLTQKNRMKTENAF